MLCLSTSADDEERNFPAKWFHFCLANSFLIFFCLVGLGFFVCLLVFGFCWFFVCFFCVKTLSTGKNKHSTGLLSYEKFNEVIAL